MQISKCCLDAQHRRGLRLCLAVWIPLAIPLEAQFGDWPPMPESMMRLRMKGNVQEMLTELRAKAETGDIASMFWLGRSFEEVEGVPHDYTEALRWYIKAANAGLGVAAWSTGRLYEMGHGTSQDFHEAQMWYTEAARLGFRRTALTHICIRWYPGPEKLHYEPAPENLRHPAPHPNPDLAYLNWPAPDLLPEELEELRNVGFTGRLVWQGASPGMFGLPARVILIAQKQVTAEVRLRLPNQGSMIYIQNGDSWQSYGNGKLVDRTIRIHPQSADMPWITMLEIETEDGGGLLGSSAWGWEHQ